MGTAVPLEAQEGNKYILTLIMKAIVAYALAAFPAIAVNPIEAQFPIEAASGPYWPSPYADPYAPFRGEGDLANPYYGYPYYAYPGTNPYFREYRRLYRAPARRHALEQQEQLYEPLEYNNDYKAVLAKRDTYSEEGIPTLQEERLTKREGEAMRGYENPDTYLYEKLREERLTKREGEAMRGYEDPDMYQYQKLQEERLTKREDLDTRVVQPNVC